jgi:hypothetical protein
MGLTYVHDLCRSVTENTQGNDPVQEFIEISGLEPAETTPIYR